MSNLKNQLDEMLGLTKASTPAVSSVADTDPAPAPVQFEQDSSDEEKEFEDPSPPLDPDELPKDKDVFASMLDQMLTAEGIDVDLEKRRRFKMMDGDLAEHVWETPHGEAIFSGESPKFRCKRCLKWCSPRMDQTMNQAMEEQGVDPICGNAIMKDVMSQ